MLRLHPTTISLTGEDISRAMDHLESSRSNTTETSLSFWGLPKPEQQKESSERPLRIHKELQNLLANEEECDQIQKHPGSNIHNDDLDGAFEGLSINSSYTNESLAEEPGIVETGSPINIEAPIGRARERAVWGPSNGTVVQLSGIQHLDGIPVSLPEDDVDWYGSMSESYEMNHDPGYLSDGGTDSLTPLLSPSGSIVSEPPSTSPQTPSPRGPVTGISLRLPGETSSEYYVTSTCPEFVGPSEPFTLMSIYNDSSQVSTHQPAPVPIADDIISTEDNADSEHSTSLTPLESRPNFRRRGLGIYDNDSNLEHIGSVFFPFSYSPEEPELDAVVAAAAARNIIPSPPRSEWDSDSRDQEGGAAWDLRGPRM